MAKMTSEQLESKMKSIVKEIMGAELEEFRHESQSKIKEAIKAESEAKQKLAKSEKGNKLGKFVSSLVIGKGNKEAAAQFAREKLGDEGVAKSLNLAEYDSGGVLAPYEYSQEIIELLRPMTAVRQLGAQTVPLVGGMIMPRQTTGANSYYVGEEGEVNASDIKMGDLKFEEKELMAVVPVSNKLIRVAGDRASQIVTNDLTQGFAVKSDQSFIRGTGTQYAPKGMRYWADSGNVFAMSDDGGSITLETVDNDLTEAQYNLKNGDIPMIQPGWIISPRTELFLMRLKDSNGNYVYKEEMMNGTLWGYPYVCTTQIPENLGLGGNETEIYFADFAQLIIAESEQISFMISDQASYRDGSGNLVSAFSKDQTVIRAKAIHDFGARHDKAISVITGVTWGA